MKLTLPCFGLDDVEVDPESFIEFPNGIAGFEDCKKFKLFHSENNPEVFWLVSIDDPSIVFSVAGPGSLGVIYSVTLNGEELDTLQAGEEDDLQIIVLLGEQEESIVDGLKYIQPHYKSPIVINVSRQIALQKILSQDKFSITVNESLLEPAGNSIPSTRENGGGPANVVHNAADKHAEHALV